MTVNLRNFFQMIIVKTSFPPLSLLYKILYIIAVRWAVLVLGNVNGVEAIYLRRGASRNKIIYGLSDIDLSVIVDDEKKTGMISAKEKVSSAYNKLSYFIPLFGKASKELGLYSTSEFFRLYADYPFFKYRFNEGKKTWKLLFGRDIAKDLPELQDSELYLPATEELKVWWSLVNVEFSSSHTLPQFQRKYLWYKAIADASKIYLFVCHREKVHDRESALHEVKKYLNQEQNQCIDQIQCYVKNLTSKDNFLVDDVMKLFMELTSHTYSEMERKVHRRTTRKRAMLPGLNYNDLIINEKASSKVEEIERYVQRELESQLYYIALIPQTYFGLDVLNNSNIDSFHVVLVQKKFMPVKKLRDLRSLVEEHRSPQQIEPLIKNGNIVLSLQPETEYESIRSPKHYPLFYSLFNHFRLDMIKRPDRRKTFQSDLPANFESCIQMRVAKINEVISNPDVYKMKPLSFLRFFWGATRTKLLSHLLENDHIHIPLTSRQICEITSQRFPENSEWLNELRREYVKELQEKESHAYRFFTKSIDFLKRI